MLCSDAILVNQGPSGGHAALLRCRTWSCEFCRPFNHRVIKRRAREGEPNSFLTLTISSKLYPDADQAARELVRAWSNMRRWIARRWNTKKPPFIAVFEQHQSGHPHLHILMRARFLPVRELSEYMANAIGSPNVWIEYVRDKGRMSAYVAKYISKAPSGFKGSKRWWRSHDYAITEEDRQPFALFSDRIYREKVGLQEKARWVLTRGWQIAEESISYLRWEPVVTKEGASPGAMRAPP